MSIPFLSSDLGSLRCGEGCGALLWDFGQVS